VVYLKKLFTAAIVFILSFFIFPLISSAINTTTFDGLDFIYGDYQAAGETTILSYFIDYVGVEKFEKWISDIVEKLPPEQNIAFYDFLKYFDISADTFSKIVSENKLEMYNIIYMTERYNKFISSGEEYYLKPEPIPVKIIKERE
jgi:hypothetical protein